MHDVITNTAQECPAQFALSSTSGDDERRIDFLGDVKYPLTGLLSMRALHRSLQL